MRQQLGLFLIGLIALSTVATLSSEVQFLSTLKNTEFGKTLLETIQIELRSNTGADAVTKVVTLLFDLKNSVVVEGRKDSASHAVNVATKNQQISSLNRRVAGLSAQLRKDRNLLKQNRAQVATASKLLAGQRVALAADKAALAKNLAAQAKATQIYRYQFSQLAAQISGLAQARQILVTLQSRSLVQTDASSFVEISSSLQNIKFSHPKFQGFIQVLAQMMTNTEQIVANQRLVGRILALVDKLYGLIVKESEFLTFAFNVQMRGLKYQEENIVFSMDIHEQAISRYEVQIARLNASTVAATQRVRDNRQRRAESRSELKDRVRQLNNLVASFNQRVVKRAGEIALLERVVVIFQTQFTADVRASLSSL